MDRGGTVKKAISFTVLERNRTLLFQEYISKQSLSVIPAQLFLLGLCGPLAVVLADRCKPVRPHIAARGRGGFGGLEGVVDVEETWGAPGERGGRGGGS